MARRPFDPDAGARRRNRALAAVGVATLVGLAVFAPTRGAAVHREVLMVTAAPGALATEAARELGELRAPAGVAPILGRLERDPHSLLDDVTATPVGIESLGRIGTPGAVPFLVRVVGGGLSTRWEGERSQVQFEILQIYRRSALKALGETRDPRAEPFLIRAMHHERDLFAVRYAMLSLAQLRTPRGRAALARYVADAGHDPNYRLIALQGLAWTSGDDWARDDLLDLLEGLDDEWLRHRAVSSVAPMVPPHALERFRPLAEAAPPGMREASLIAAGDASERRASVERGGAAIQQAMLTMSFALDYAEGGERQRTVRRFCTLAPDRPTPGAGVDASTIRRERRIGALAADLCTT